MTYRVAQWSTGNVGRHAIAGIDARPDLELVGVWVSSAEKDGKDAGALAVPAVVSSPPGLLTALDLPLVTGRGLVR